MLMVDYKRLFRGEKLNSPDFKHLFLLLYWPVYGLMFWLMERGLSLTYHPVVSDFDSKIPFCEYYVFPYYFWFVFLAGIHIYTLLFDVPAFKKLMYFIIITYTVTTVIYLVYPTCQELRPTEFERDNFCVWVVKALYAFDTNTNVCPSLHVIGSFAVLFTTWHIKRFKTPLWQLALWIITIAISISTVFLKQHSVIDIYAALAVCAVSYPFAYILPDRIAQKRSGKAASADRGTCKTD